MYSGSASIDLANPPTVSENSGIMSVVVPPEFNHYSFDGWIAAEDAEYHSCSDLNPFNVHLPWIDGIHVPIAYVGALQDSYHREGGCEDCPIDTSDYQWDLRAASCNPTPVPACE